MRMPCFTIYVSTAESGRVHLASRREPTIDHRSRHLVQPSTERLRQEVSGLVVELTDAILFGGQRPVSGVPVAGISNLVASQLLIADG